MIPSSVLGCHPSVSIQIQTVYLFKFGLYSADTGNTREMLLFHSAEATNKAAQAC